MEKELYVKDLELQRSLWTIQRDADTWAGIHECWTAAENEKSQSWESGLGVQTALKNKWDFGSCGEQQGGAGGHYKQKQRARKTWGQGH